MALIDWLGWVTVSSRETLSSVELGLQMWATVTSFTWVLGIA